MTRIIDIMLDLETLGVGSRPVIIQLAAVAFDLQTGQTFEEFDELINPRTSLKVGLKMDDSTLDWWGKQDPEVFKQVVIQAIKKGRLVKKVLALFSQYILDIKKNHALGDEVEVRLWSNGFDCSWLSANYEAVGLNMPVNFWNCCDVRSLVDVGRRILNYDPKKTIPNTGLAHKAVDDCKKQIKYTVGGSSKD